MKEVFVFIWIPIVSFPPQGMPSAKLSAKKHGGQVLRKKLNRNRVSNVCQTTCGFSI